MLEVKNLYAGYGDKSVLRDLSVCFERGKLTSVIGVNGCGKSTLLGAILGMIRIDSGEVLADGESLLSMKRREIAKKVAYLAQGRNLPDMTVSQLVLHGRFPYLSYPRRYSSRDREIAEEAIERVGMSEYADSPLCALSGGMRQSAYIAMALAQSTDYLLLDEPTTHLDISHQLGLMRLLRELAASGKGIAVVMHDIPMAFELSDRIAVLSEGRIVAYGAPDELCGSDTLKNVFGVSIERLGEGDKYFYSYRQLE